MWLMVSLAQWPFTRNLILFSNLTNIICSCPFPDCCFTPHIRLNISRHVRSPMPKVFEPAAHLCNPTVPERRSTGPCQAVLGIVRFFLWILLEWYFVYYGVYKRNKFYVTIILICTPVCVPLSFPYQSSQ